MGNWMIDSAELLALICDRMYQCLIRQKVLQADETPTEVLKDNGHKATDKSYMWGARTVLKSATPSMIHFAVRTIRKL